MTNVSQLRVPLPASLTRRTKEAQDKDVSFLAFRQLNKRARVRISSLPFGPDHLSNTFHLFAIANAKSWFAAVTQTAPADFAVIFAPLIDLHTAFLSEGQNDELSFTPRRVMRTSGMPTIIVFTVDASRMLMSFKDGRISVFDTSVLFTAGSDDINPLHTWPPSPYAPQQILPNPGDMANLIAVLLEPGAAQSVVVLDVQKHESLAGWERDNPADPISTISWSPKGKQLAIGLKSGSITTFLPTETSVPKLIVPSPAFATPLDLVSMIWLTNDTFYTIYSLPSPDIDHTHIVVTLDSKAGILEVTKFGTPYFLLPDITPVHFTLTLRNWEPAKVLLLVGVSASSDIGIIGDVDDGWCNIYLEEIVTPKMPLDGNGNEVMLTALELDLSNEANMGLTGYPKDFLPPAPILYGFASDGTIQGWYVIQTDGLQYPAMVQSSASAYPGLGSPPSQSSTSIRSPTLEKASVPRHSMPDSSFDQQMQAISTAEEKPRASSNSQMTHPVSAFGQASFQSPFGSPSTSAFSGFAAQQTKPTHSPAFGHSGFQQPGDKPANFFGQSGFGTFSPPPTAQPLGGGFASFAKGGMMSFSDVGATSGDSKKEPSKSAFGGGGGLFSQSSSSAIKPGFLGADFSSAFAPASGAVKSTFAIPSTGAHHFGNAPSTIGTPANTGASPVFGSTSALATSKPLFGATPTSEPVFGSSSLIGNTQSAFGVSSTLGGQRPVFGGTAPQTQSHSTKAVGFSAFSGSTGGFGAFSGAQKSFGELLREQSRETSESSASASTAASIKEETTSKTKPLASFLSSAGPSAVDKGGAKESFSPFAKTELALPGGADTITHESKTSTDTKTTQSSPKMIFPSVGVGEQEQDKSGIQREASIAQPSDQSLSDSFSFSSLNSSFVDISETNSTEKDDGEGFEADMPSSPSTLSEQSESSEHDHPSRDHDQTSPSVTPEQAVRIPLPVTPVLSSRSLSTTPKPEIAAIQPVSTSPSPPPVSEINTITKHTTPPSFKAVTNTVSLVPPARPPNLIPAPVPVPAANPLKALGLGKPPTNRPTRSSPLASTSVSVAITTGQEPKPTGPSHVPRPQPAAPKSPFGQIVELPKFEKPHQGMQTECLNLFASLGKELESLRQLVVKTGEKREAMNRSTKLPSRVVDGSVKAKLTIKDINRFGEILAQTRSDISSLKRLKAEHWSSIRALRGQMLKAGTKKEEVTRFDHAKTDVELADILRERTLGPEHRETQNQLRKSVRVMRDRIQKLEDHLYASKKKLERMKSGKPSFTAPSLDTINRTFRNIDIAIDQQARDVADLTSRIARFNLNLRMTSYMPVARDKRLPDIVSKRPYNITPNVAVTTAAALNAERSAQKLKRALLAARKQPYLNTKAAPASEAPIAFTPPRFTTSQATATSSHLYSPSPVGMTGQNPRYDDSELHLEELSVSTLSLPTRRTAGTGIKHHNKPIALRRGGGTKNSPPVANFDWGPLPSITPMRTLSADVRKKDGESSG